MHHHVITLRNSRLSSPTITPAISRNAFKADKSQSVLVEGDGSVLETRLLLKLLEFGAIEFRKVTFHQLSLEGLTSLPALAFADCTFDNNDAPSPSYNAQGATFTERLFFTSCVFWGEVSFRKASLSSSLDFRNCSFFQTHHATSLNLRDTLCNGSINLSGSCFGGHVDASRLRLSGSFRTASRQHSSTDTNKESCFAQNLDLNSARIEGNLSLRSVTVRGTLDLHEAVIGGALILKPYGIYEPSRSSSSKCNYVFGRFLKVGGEIDFRNTIFEGAVNLESVQAGSLIAGSVSFGASNEPESEPYTTTFKSLLNLSHSRLRGDLILSGSLLGNGLLATRAEIDGHLKIQSRRGKRTKLRLGPVTGNKSDPTWAVRLESANIKGYVSFASSDIEGPVWASNLFVGGDLFMDTYASQDTCTFSNPWQPLNPQQTHSPIYYDLQPGDELQRICSPALYASFADATVLGAIYFRPKCVPGAGILGTFDFNGSRSSSFNAGICGQVPIHKNWFDLSLSESRVEGPIDVSGLRLRGLNVSHARCEGDLVLSHDDANVTLEERLGIGYRLYHTTISFVHGSHLTLAGDFVGYGVHFFEGCNLEHAHISGDLILHRSHICSLTHKDGYELSLALSHATIKGHVSGRGLLTTAAIDGSFMKIGGDIDFSYNKRFGLMSRIGASKNQKIEGPRLFCLWLRGSDIKGMIRLHAVHLDGGISLRESTIRGSLYLSSSSVSYEGDEPDQLVEGSYSAPQSPRSGATLRYRNVLEEVVTRVGKSKNTHSEYSIDARGSIIGGGLYWENLKHSSGAQCESALNFSGATLSSVSIEGVAFGLNPDEPSPNTKDLLDLSVSRVSLDIKLTDVRGPVSCDGAKIGGSLRVQSEALKNAHQAGEGTWPLKLSARGVEIAGELLLLSDWIERMSNMSITSAKSGHQHDIGLNLSGAQVSRIEFVTGNRPKELDRHSIWHVLWPFLWFDETPLRQFDRSLVSGGRVLTISRATVKELEVTADLARRSWAKSQHSIVKTALFKTIEKLPSNKASYRLKTWARQSCLKRDSYSVESFADPRVQTAASGLLQCFVSFTLLVLFVLFSDPGIGSRVEQPVQEWLPSGLLLLLVLVSLKILFDALRTARDATWRMVFTNVVHPRKACTTKTIGVDSANHLTRAVAYLLHKTKFSGSFFLRVADFCSRKGYRLLADEVYLYSRRREEKEFSAIVGFMPLIGHFMLKYGVRGRFWSLGLVCAILVGWQSMVFCLELRELYYGSFLSSSLTGEQERGGSGFPYITSHAEPSAILQESSVSEPWILDSALVFGQEVFGSGFGPNALWGGKSSEIRAEASRVSIMAFGNLSLSFGVLVTVVRLWWFAFLTISVSRLVGLIRRHSIDGSSRS